jgi:hypothetical protein
MSTKSAVIENLSREAPLSAIGTRWQFFTVGVMGGISKATMLREAVAGRPAIRMQGDVSLANSGGFVQNAMDLAPDESEVNIPAQEAASTGPRRAQTWQDRNQLANAPATCSAGQ